MYPGIAHFTPPGSMFLLPPGEVHSNYANGEGCSYANIYLPATHVESVTVQITKTGMPAMPLVICDKCIHAQFLELCSVLESSELRLQQDAAFFAFFEELIDHLGNQQPVRDSLERDEGMLAILNGTNFKDGIIEVELAGAHRADAAPSMRGFIGIAFRVQNHSEAMECFYRRPSNGRADDQFRRNHSLHTSPIQTTDGNVCAGKTRVYTSLMLISSPASGRR